MTAITTADTCRLCEPDPEIRKELSPRNRCSKCVGKYTTREVRSILAKVRRVQDHGIHSENDAKLAAEAGVILETIRRLDREGILRDVELNALVNHCMLLQVQQEVADESEVTRETMNRAVSSALKKLVKALNGETG